MTAITDIAQARIDALYPDEGYDLRSRTFKNANITNTDLEGSGATSGAVRAQNFLTFFLPTIWSMPTLEELKELFLEELAQGKITPPPTTAPKVSSTAIFDETNLDIPSPILIFLYLSIFAAILCLVYFYLIGIFVGITHVVTWIQGIFH